MFFMKNSLEKSSKLNENMNSFTGLKILINYHRICCVSYFGAQLDKHKGIKYFCLRFLLIVWNLAFLSYYSYYFYDGIYEEILKLQKSSFDTSKSIIMFIVWKIGIFGFYIQTFAINILLMIRGNKILLLLRSQTLEYIDDKSEKKIGFNIAVKQFLFGFLLQILINLLFHGYYSIEYKTRIDIKRFLKTLIHYFLIFNSQTTIIAIIAYQSHIVSHQLNSILNSFLRSDIQNVYRFVSETNYFIKKLDALISPLILISLFFSVNICIAFFCMFAIDPKKYLILSIGSIIVSLSLLISNCLTCDKISKEFEKFFDKLEDSVTKSNVNSQLLNQLYEHSLLSKAKAIGLKIGFTACNLFKISTNTIISCLALILSYSVVLIQTSNEK